MATLRAWLNRSNTRLAADTFGQSVILTEGAEEKKKQAREKS